MPGIDSGTLCISHSADDDDHYLQIFLHEGIFGPHTQSEPCFADIHGSDGSSSSSQQNPKSTAKWAASLENLLEDPEGVKRFRVCLFHC